MRVAEHARYSRQLLNNEQIMLKLTGLLIASMLKHWKNKRYLVFSTLVLEMFEQDQDNFVHNLFTMIITVNSYKKSRIMMQRIPASIKQ